MRRLIILAIACLFCFIGSATSGYAKPKSPPPAPVFAPRKTKHGPPPHAPAHGYRRKYTYRYYPHSKVYYDTERKVYFYLGKGGWTVGVTLPASIQIAPREAVIMHLETDRPYTAPHQPHAPERTVKDKGKRK